MARPLRPNSTQVPDVILDKWMALLSGGEFKVLMYIVRRTYGFQKDGDSISLKQIVGGIVKRDGTRLDSGTGLNKDTVCKALASLEKMALITREHREDETGDLPNYYSLNLEAEHIPAPKSLSENPTGGSESSNSSPGPVGNSDTEGVPIIRHTPVGKTHDTQSDNPTQQQADLQETEKQKTATAENDSPSSPKVFAADFSPSAFPEGEEGVSELVAIGFSVRDSRHIASANPVHVIREQLEWLPLRTVRKNRLGMLRKAIEERWPRPESAREQEKREVDATQSANEAAKESRKQEIARQLRVMYSRLESDAPEAFSAYMAYVEEDKQRQSLRPLVRDNPKRLQILLKAYDTEEKRIEMMVEFFRGREVPMPEFVHLMTTISDQQLPAAEFLRHAG